MFAHEVILVSTRHVGRKEQEDDVEVEEDPAPDKPEPKRQRWAKKLQELQVETAWDSAEYKSYFNSSDKESVMECLACSGRGLMTWRM
jgi:hypothetical protein